eukprot:SAG31_NODE_524_length_14529_cov_23.084130_2_plen_170_part_00
MDVSASPDRLLSLGRDRIAARQWTSPTVSSRTPPCAEGEPCHDGKLCRDFPQIAPSPSMVSRSIQLDAVPLTRYTSTRKSTASDLDHPFPPSNAIAARTATKTAMLKEWRRTWNSAPGRLSQTHGCADASVGAAVPQPPPKNALWAAAGASLRVVWNSGCKDERHRKAV